MTHTAKTLSEMARIRRAVEYMPRSLRELSELLSMPYWKVSRLVRFMTDADRVHVSFDLPHIHAGRPIPFFLAGSKSTGERYAQIVASLREQPATVAQLSKRSGIGYNLAARCIASLKAQERIHVDAWEKDGSGMTRVWAAGRGKDAPKPPSLKSSPRSRYDPATDPEALIERANQRKAAAIKPFRDPFVAAMFGDAA